MPTIGHINNLHTLLTSLKHSSDFLFRQRIHVSALFDETSDFHCYIDIVISLLLFKQKIVSFLVCNFWFTLRAKKPTQRGNEMCLVTLAPCG